MGSHSLYNTGTYVLALHRYPLIMLVYLLNIKYRYRRDHNLKSLVLKNQNGAILLDTWGEYKAH